MDLYSDVEEMISLKSVGLETTTMEEDIKELSSEWLMNDIEAWEALTEACKENPMLLNIRRHNDSNKNTKKRHKNYNLKCNNVSITNEFKGVGK